jgi:threonine synthase
MIVDPHTAVGVAASLKLGLKGPVILLATAHPAKFPEAITQAIGIAPVIPPKLAGLMAQEERYTVLPNEAGAVRTFVLERTGTS